MWKLYSNNFINASFVYCKVKESYKYIWKLWFIGNISSCSSILITFTLQHKNIRIIFNFVPNLVEIGEILAVIYGFTNRWRCHAHSPNFILLHLRCKIECFWLNYLKHYCPFSSFWPQRYMESGRCYHPILSILTVYAE